ncbi:MAG: sulfatase [Chthoniobacteraceae bacterium]
MRFLLPLLALLLAAHDSPAADKPNIIIFLIDDLGATDLGCTGSTFYETPNIDRLAKDGCLFPNTYAACTVCSPTRSAIITGKYPARLHITDWIAGHNRPFAKLKIPDWQQELPKTEKTIAHWLGEAGYRTCAIGKWHLSPGGPAAHGFDIAIADNHKGQPASYLSPYHNPNITDGPPGESLTHRLTEEAAKFITTKSDKPFFLYFAHYAVHTPLGARPEVTAKYEEKAKITTPQGKAKYAAMIEGVDDSVGRIRALLAEQKLADNTLIIFTSDNGGLILGDVTSNLGMRAGKGSAYEGGVRVAGIVDWPGVSRPGTTNATPVITMDWFATVLDAAGVKAPSEGVSVRPLLRGEKVAPRPLFWHYPHYHPGGATPYSAIRDGDFRLVHFYEDGRDELYNLAADPEEKRDLAATEKEKTAALRAKLDTWLKETGAQFPTPNPNYDPAKDAPKRAGKK